jgi:hypothetical protein
LRPNVRFMISAGVLVASIASGTAQEFGVSSYGPDLKRLTVLAMSGNQFATIAGKPREGNFRDTTLPLADWEDCALYGAIIYTCDSHPMKTSQEAKDALVKTTDQILRCPAGAWVEIKDRSSSAYTVLHAARGAASITLSLDENDKNEYVVRFTLFLRRP